MKFRKIIESAKSAWDALLRFFRKRLPDCGRKSGERSEDQNPENSPTEEKTETATPSSEATEKSQTQVPIRDDVKDIKSDESKDPADAPPETPPDPPKEETPTPLDSSKKPKPQSENGQDKDSKERSDDPVKAPGKRGEEPKKPAEDGNRPAKPPRPQPPQCRFVCYEETDGHWAIALAVESGQEVQSVWQGDNELSANGGRYILKDIAAEVTVKFKDGHSPKSFQLLKEDQFVVFKMRKNWKGKGQKVNTLFSGDYVVFAHKSCGKRIGKPPIEAEQCRYDDFMAHFFSVSENSERDGFENCSLPYSRFSLKGQRFPDDSDLGELFGNNAPQLADAEEGREVSWIVVGRENGGKVLDKFRPEEKTLAEVLGERSGWFFVRIYNAKVKLLDSFDFRRAKGLKNIFVNNQPLGKVAPIVPTKNEHTKTIVQFEGDLPVRSADNSDGTCKVTENKNTFAVLPHPDNDRTKWVLGSGEDCVKSEILLPRIWWKFIKEKGKEGDWRDTPIKMKREEFRGAKNEKIRIRLPLCIPEIVVGFGDLNSSPSKQTFPTKLSKNRKTCEAEFRLDDFYNDQAIEKPLSESVDLCVKLKDSDVGFPIVRILPDPPPPVIKGCNLLELKKAKEELYQEGWIDAAKAAEEFEKDAKGLWMRIRFGEKCLTICFDLQRKSMEAKNVEKLKAFFKKHFEKE